MNPEDERGLHPPLEGSSRAKLALGSARMSAANVRRGGATSSNSGTDEEERPSPHPAADITGVCHHVSPQHLKRYLAEYDFRYDERTSLNVTGAERATKAVAGVVGNRMTYQQPDDRTDKVPF